MSKIDHPHALWSPGQINITLVNTNFHDHTVTNTYQRTNASYVLSYSFEPGREWLRQRQQRLDSYRQSGLADTSREVVTETLNVMTLSFAVQSERINQVLNQPQHILLHNYHQFGRMGQEAGKGYYIDIYQAFSGDFPAGGNSASQWAEGDKQFDLHTYFASALEHAIIEQTSTNLTASSTIKMLQLANTNGTKIFLAQSNTWSSIRSQLTSYTTADLDRFGSNALAGATLLIPKDALTTLAGTGSWTGYGVIERLRTTNLNSTRMTIAGGYHGGYAPFPDAKIIPQIIASDSALDPFRFLTGYPWLPNEYGADPVNMADGSFQLTTTDLSLGHREPRGMTFTRYYNPTRRNHNLTGMANGWMHNYFFNAAEVSAPLPALGETTPAQMVSMIVATKAAYELYSTSGDAKNWMVTALIAKWGVDQLIHNAVSVNLGNDTIQFIRQPDGKFTAPAGSTMTLTNTGTAYNLLERHGNTFKFSSAGRLTNIVDQYGKGLTLTYNASNWIATATDWKGRMLTFNYSGSPSRLTSVTDNTRTVSYGYTTNAGQVDLASVTDAESKTSTFLYDTNHQMLATKNALNQTVTSNLYDSFGRVIEQYSKGDTNQTWRLFWSGFINTEQDPMGNKRRFFYDDKSRLTGSQDALSNLSQSFYDGQDHVTMTISPLSETNRFEFDGRHNLLRMIDPLNFTNQFVYDAQDNLSRTVDARGNSNFFGYNAKFQLTASTNGAGDLVSYTYDSGDGTLATKADAGGTTSYSYDTYGQLNSITYPGSLGGEGFLNSVNGDVLSRTNARSFITTFQYSLRRELTNTIAPTNLTAKVSFDAVGNIASMTDARAFTRTNVWSPTRKLLATIMPQTPQGTPIMTNVYDTRDWLSQTKNPLQQTTQVTNDAAQRLISITDPLLRTTRISYDADGRKLSITNPASEVTSQQWNARGEITRSIDGAGHTVSKVFDANGNQITLTNRNGKKWQFQFDAANRLTNTITPLGRSTSLTFNNRGLLASIKEPSTETATLTYDAKGRLTNRTDNVGSVAYRYDANNNVTDIVGQASSLSFTYDAYDRVSTYRDADNNLLQYRYDQNGNLTNLVYPGGKVVTYIYDSLNRLTNVTDWANRKTTYTYDLASRLTSITRPNLTQRTNRYDEAGQLTNIVEVTAIGFPIALFRHNWNSNSTMQWEFAAPLPHTNAPPTRTMTYDDDNRLSTVNGSAVTVDADGNLTYGPLTNGSFGTYTYDARNALLSAGSLSYGYNPGNNRTSITNGTNVTKFIINPNAALSQALIRVKNGVTNYYVYGLGLLYEAYDDGGTKSYHYDYRGSTVALTDGSGNVTDRIEYSAYGSLTYRSGTTDTPFLYNGRYGVQTDANGLLYLRARYYNPYLCRFINPDPAGFTGGLNFYTYADGNPISLIDPFGLFTVAIGLQGNGAVGLQGSTSYQFTLSINGINPLDWRGGMAVSFMPLTGVSTGVGGAAGIIGSFSPAERPEQWSGWSGTTGISGGAFLIGGGDVSNIGSGGPLVYSAFLGEGLKPTPPGLPVEWHFGASYTEAVSISPREIWNAITDTFSPGKPLK